MRDEPLSESLTPIFEEIKNLIRSGNAEEAHNHFLALLNQTASSEIVEGYLSFACDYFPKSQVLGNLVDSCISHFQEGNLSRTAIKMSLIIKAISDIIDMQAENLPSYHLLSSAVTSMKNPPQFLSMLKECLKEQEFQTNGEELQQSVNRFLSLLENAAPGTPPPSQPFSSPAPKPATTPKPNTVPKPAVAPTSAVPPKIEKFSPSSGAGKPGGAGHGFLGSLDEPMYPSEFEEPPPSKAPVTSTPKEKSFDLDAPLSGQNDLPAMPDSSARPKISKSISFDTPLESAQEESHFLLFSVVRFH